MSLGAFLRQQLDRDPLEHGRLALASCAAVGVGYLVFMAGVYAGLSPQDAARESGFVLTLLSPIVLMFALPIGLGLALLAYAVSLFLPRHALGVAWVSTWCGVLVASALSGWAWGPLSIVIVPVFALALAALTWILFPSRGRA
jgi:hypothetical protein